MGREYDFMPCRGWLFVEPVDERCHTIVDVGVDLDECRIGNTVEFTADYKKPHQLQTLGMIAIKNVWITKEVENGHHASSFEQRQIPTNT
jgi:hypothetical protein